jgi:thymidylate synthase
MQHWEESYRDLIRQVLDQGDVQTNRTGTNTYVSIGHSLRIPLDPFPIITGKKVLVQPLFSELKWFIAGDTNVLTLMRENCNIWNPWACERFTGSKPTPSDIHDYKTSLLAGTLHPAHGDLGPIYGAQWRDFGGVDQLAGVVKSLQEDPYSRRHIVSAWNPPMLPEMALPPCHLLYQAHVVKPNSHYHDPVMQERADRTGKAISLTMTQRSADLFLGVPFNISSYAGLAHWLSHMTGYAVRDLVMNFGNAHLYEDHVEPFRRYEAQCETRPACNPILHVGGGWEPTFTLSGYQHAPFIPAPVAV